MATGGWVQASPDHCSQSRVSGTDRRNRNHINPAWTKRGYSRAYDSKQKQENIPSSAACVTLTHCCLLVFHEGCLPPTPLSRGQETGTLQGHYRTDDVNQPVGDGMVWALYSARTAIFVTICRICCQLVYRISDSVFFFVFFCFFKQSPWCDGCFRVHKESRTPQSGTSHPACRLKGKGMGCELKLN